MLYVYIDMYNIHPCNKMFIVKVPSSTYIYNIYIIASILPLINPVNENKKTMAVILIG